jgi:hypothetical protein
MDRRSTSSRSADRVELVDRTMIDLAGQPRRSVDDAERRRASARPAAILLVEFAATTKPPCCAAAASSNASATSAPRGVVECRGRAQKRSGSVRKAGLNIMMSLKGDGKPVSFIEDCASRSSTSPTTPMRSPRCLRAPRKPRHLVRPRRRSGTLHVRPFLDMRREGRGEMRSIAERRSAWWRYKGAYSGEHGDGLPRRMDPWQFGPKPGRRVRAIKRTSTRSAVQPNRIVDPPRWTTPRCSASRRPRLPHDPVEPALDWSAWNVQNDPATEETRPGTGGDTPAARQGREMCNNNGHCRKFDAGTMCPATGSRATSST